MQPNQNGAEVPASADPHAQLAAAIDECRHRLKDIAAAASDLGDLKGSVSASTLSLQMELVVSSVVMALGDIERLWEQAHDEHVLSRQRRINDAESHARTLEAAMIKHSETLRLQGDQIANAQERLEATQDRAIRLQNELQKACYWIEELCGDGALLKGHREELIRDARRDVEAFSV